MDDLPFAASIDRHNAFLIDREPPEGRDRRKKRVFAFVVCK